MIILASLKLPWKSLELKEFGDQVEMFERSRFYNMHDEDVKRINYLKTAFLERISVYEGEGHTHTSKKHSEFLSAWTKSMCESNTLLNNILVTETLGHHITLMQRISI